MRAPVLLLCVLSACAPVAGQPVTPEQDPRLLAALFDDARSIEGQLATDFACVSIRDGAVDRDPDAALITDLQSRWSVPVFAGSRCSLRDDGSGVSAPGVTGSGKWLRVSKLNCSSADRCTADVNYYVANMGSGGRGVIAERTNNGWKITPSGAAWIS